jgi:nitrite reductase/ring-hydroxylating ferredoxin subunit
MKLIQLIEVANLKNKEPEHGLVGNTDLVIVKFDDEISILYGRCLHRGALMSDGHVDGHNLICGVHGWDYRVDTGVSEYNNKEVLHKFTTHIEAGFVCVAQEEVDAFEKN